MIGKKLLSIYVSCVFSLLMLPLFINSSSEACTGFLSVGKASADGRTLMMKVRDASGWLQRVCLVTNPSGGIKYLGVEEAADRDKAGYGKRLKSGINEKGVGGVSLLLFSWEKETTGPDTAEVLRIGLEKGATAKGSVDGVAKAIEKGFAYGAGGCSLLFNDPQEAWYMELSGRHWGAKGPIRNDTFSCSNYYQIPEMEKYESAAAIFKEKTMGRKQRAQSLLEGIRGEITIPFLMQFSRDQKFPPERAYSYDNRIICNEGWNDWSVSGNIAVSDPKYPDILSVLWVAINRPNVSPFIPFYIGLTELPKEFENEGASETFNELRTLVDENPKHRDWVAQTWKNFEYRQLGEVTLLERKIITMLKNGDKKGAQILLNTFVKGKSDEAMKIAQQLIKKIKE